MTEKSFKFEFAGYHKDHDIHLVGKIIVTLLLLILGFQALTSFLTVQAQVIDRAKRVHMETILKTLNLYYSDSSSFLEEREYPIAACSNELNSFDYEYSLRTKLIGRQVITQSHGYIKSEQFPVDPSGSYREELGSNFLCREVLPEQFRNSATYFDRFKVCQFDISANPNCYLYTSSLSGDGYRLSYYSPHYKKYVVYSKYRTKELEIKLY